ncbi:Pantothenate kinase 2 [Platanthera guangdongensis]|uniref:Pantothenate kinase 2 n=1 Tax=Platanthera guangdongensis TaxID=2320717 RepID=A0ABR2N099_9ASPA
MALARSSRTNLVGEMSDEGCGWRGAVDHRYEPNTIDLLDHSELEYWFTVLSEHMPDLVDKPHIPCESLNISPLYYHPSSLPSTWRHIPAEPDLLCQPPPSPSHPFLFSQPLSPRGATAQPFPSQELLYQQPHITMSTSNSHQPRGDLLPASYPPLGIAQKIVQHPWTTLPSTTHSFLALVEFIPAYETPAVASEGGTDDAKRRGEAFAHAFSAHLARSRSRELCTRKRSSGLCARVHSSRTRSSKLRASTRSLKLCLHTRSSELRAQTRSSELFAGAHWRAKRKGARWRAVRGMHQRVELGNVHWRAVLVSGLKIVARGCSWISSEVFRVAMHKAKDLHSSSKLPASSNDGVDPLL